MEPTVCRPKRVCFLSEDSETVERVSARLAEGGIEVLAFSELEALAAGMGPPAETILALDTDALPPDQDVPQLLNHIDGLSGGRPVLVCVARSDAIERRLQALRAGAEAFVASPVPVDELSARLLELSGVSGEGQYRVMVVDDQPVAATFAARVLQSAGMEVRIVGDALHVLETLDQLRPDLVLMDLYMPGADGIELTTLIRAHDELFETPVIFLSSELDSGRQMDAFRVGGNDFIAKPVRPERLVEIVRRRIRSHRSMISRAEKACAQARVVNGDGIERCGPLLQGDCDAERDVQLIGLIKGALGGDGGFHLMHQSIMALRQLPGERYETTLRLKTGHDEYVPAFDFLPAARRHGLMPAIDRWVMEQALEELKEQREAHRRLRFFVHQTMETMSAPDWLSWFRDQIVSRDLIRERPVLQFQYQDLSEHRALAAARFPGLHGLAIKTCLNVSECEQQESDLIGDLGVSLVRLSLQTVMSLKSNQLEYLIDQLHELGSQVIIARIEQPQAIARAWRSGADFIQGNFLQFPSRDLSFDFSESALM